MDNLKTVLSYHEATKHHPHRYARSLGYMDWATQPDPFRRFCDTRTVELVLEDLLDEPRYDELYEPDTIAPQPLTLESISLFLQFSLAISAWKEFQGNRWALRINPSSGNLHPTEGYVVVDAVEGIGVSAGVYHYRSDAHVLEERCRFPCELWRRLTSGLPDGSFLVGLTSIHWREAWKYGERAYRYCQHDVGHALASLTLAASLNGWFAWPLAEMSDDDIYVLLALDQANGAPAMEREHPDLLLAIVPGHASGRSAISGCLDSEALKDIRKCQYFGTANTLSTAHVDWPIIEDVSRAANKPRTTHMTKQENVISDGDRTALDIRPLSARAIIHQRRSAVAMDSQTSISAEQFFRLLDRCVPRPSTPPWSSLDAEPHVHLLLMVHRVRGISTGLYMLVRNSSEHQNLRNATRGDFAWTRVAGAPKELPLYLLMEGNVRHLAEQVSCGQSIAGDGTFSVGMIAAFEQPLRAHGPWLYRCLFWETGMIGQILYLEAEAMGIRGTGIGCFFDDLVHEVLGLKGIEFQSLYHFTVGGAVDDPRLTTLPAYPVSVVERSRA